MNQEDKKSSNSNGTPWGEKAKYIGTGIAIGLIISPWIKKAISQLQPKAEALLDQLTGKTEEFAERASDLLAKAKDQFHSKNEEVIADDVKHENHTSDSDAHHHPNGELHEQVLQ